MAEERLPFFGPTVPVPEAYEQYRGRLMRWHSTIYDALPSEYRNMGLGLLWDLSGSIQNAMTCQAKESLKKLNRYTIGVTSLMNLLPKEARARASDLYEKLTDETIDILVGELRSRCGCRIDKGGE